MIFVLHNDRGDDAAIWVWTYNQGSKANVGHALAGSSVTFATEQSAREDIARARTAFAAARYAPVIAGTEVDTPE